MNKIIMLLGTFGAGKTSIVKARPHTTLSPVESEVSGLISLGGPNGADVLSSKGYKTERTNTELIRPERSYIIHSILYQSYVNFRRWKETHEVTAIVLLTSEENIKSRIAMRGKTYNPVTFARWKKQLPEFAQYAHSIGVSTYVVDNNRSFPEVSQEVWDIIDDAMKLSTLLDANPRV